MISLRTRFVSFALLLAYPASDAQTPASNRITQTIDTGQLVRLTGSVHPLAKHEFDQGRLNGNTMMHGVSLIFSRSSSQQQALQALLAEQQDPASPNFHKWLTPEQFADRFGLTSNDVAQVTRWLESEGFVIDRVARSRTQISFTGSVARIESVFHTEIHSYLTNGERHFANTTDLQIPAALQGVVLGVRNLDDFHPKPRNTGRRRIPVSPNLTSSLSGSHFMVPEDFATIYDVTALYGAGFDGSGEKIAVIGDSEITMSNIETFRSLAGLSKNDPTKTLVPGSGNPTVPSASEQVEAYLDLEWAGAVAENASIIYVYVGDKSNYSVWDALQYAIDNKVASVVSTSFGYCEAGLGRANTLTIQGWAQQANSQGQTISAASGDSGAADCDSPSVTVATHGLAVDVPAAIPEVTGVGGSEFAGDSASTSTTTYWNGTNDGVYGSALTYIPEEVWNDTTESIAAGSGLAAGGGGTSIYFSKPSWQTGTGVPNDAERDVPDISLNASPFHDPYLICGATDGAGNQSCTNGFRDSKSYVDAVGGTSVGVPAFAGILALIDQATGSKGLGNVNSTLYSLAASAPSTFHDITSGDNKVPCASGSSGCTGATMGFSAGTGYDQASGLGSIDVYKLATKWTGYSSAPNYSVSASPTSVNVSAGQSGTSTITVTATGGFIGTVTLTCSVSSSTAMMGCSLSPAWVALYSTTTSATSTLTVTTTGSSARLGPSAAFLSHGGQFEWLAGSCGVVLGCFGLFGFTSSWRQRRVGTTLLFFVLLMLGSACGGDNSGTPKGSYTVTVTGTSGSHTHSATVSVGVQ
jgi:subtilase family serine protease